MLGTVLGCPSPCVISRHHQIHAPFELRWPRPAQVDPPCSLGRTRRREPHRERTPTRLSRCSIALAAQLTFVGLRTAQKRFGARRNSKCRRCAVQRVLEMFSGIGGMRVAFDLAMDDLQHKSTRARCLERQQQWRAMEIDQSCCKAYCEIFGASETCGALRGMSWNDAAHTDEMCLCSIDRLPLEALDGADLWLLSPPCQPFTRTSHQLDLQDRRCAALLHLMACLPNLKHPPAALLLENVPEFMQSSAAQELRKTLGQQMGYHLREHILDPCDFGFPNTRRRYYCVATRDALDVAEEQAALASEEPRLVREFCKTQRDGMEATVRDELRVPQALLSKLGGYRPDVAVGGASATKTFTAAYGKPNYGSLVRAGPVLLTAGDGTCAPAEDSWERFSEIDEADFARLRYFHPDEILALQGFPVGWRLPAWLSLRRQWKLIGNSINATVVARLLRPVLSHLEA